MRVCVLMRILCTRVRARGHFAVGCPAGRPKYQVVSSLHPSAMPLRYPLLFPAGEDGFHPNIPLCGVPPSQVANRQKLRADRQWRTKTATMRMKTARKGTKRMVMANDEGQVKGSRWRVSRSQFFARYLPKATSTSQSRIAPNVPSWKSLRLTKTQGINGLTPNQIGRSMTLGSIKNRPRDIMWQRYQDAMACVVKHGKPPLLITMTYDPELPEIKAALGPNDKACNRPDLIVQVFEVNPVTSDMQAVLTMNVG
ncbi:BQ5605_C032g11096 [Microbotryum silenes-dioicae]|uniref:BQ5605_C032g11096 protein n=1 Tax=Microbotryum silenes-dioicae TaxID=796604 RepID=A0A2X0NAC2_9BASI|nr:BQ5605_C032g11096 [Microbotryum silenes-dioicae]